MKAPAQASPYCWVHLFDCHAALMRLQPLSCGPPSHLRWQSRVVFALRAPLLLQVCDRQLSLEIWIYFKSSLKWLGQCLTSGFQVRFSCVFKFKFVQIFAWSHRKRECACAPTFKASRNEELLTLSVQVRLKTDGLTSCSSFLSDWIVG